MQRCILGDEGDALESLERAGRKVSEHRDVPVRRGAEPDGAMQQRRLAGPVRSYEGDDATSGHSEIAVTKGPGPAIALREP